MSDVLSPPRVNLRNLSTIGFAVGITHFAYKAGDHTINEVMAPGYWNAAGLKDRIPLIHAGDWIFVSGQRWALQVYVMQAGDRVEVRAMISTLPLDL